MRSVKAQNNDREKNVVRRNNLVNPETTFSLIPTIAKAFSSTQNICLTISLHPTSTYTISRKCHQYTLSILITFKSPLFQIFILPQFHFLTMKTSMNNQHLIYFQDVGRIFSHFFHEDLGKKLHNMIKTFDEDLRSRICQSLKYENSCVYPNIELLLGYTLPKFNTTNGKGNAVIHLKDYCNKLVGIGHGDAI